MTNGDQACQLLSVRRGAALLALSESTLRRMIRRGHIASVRLGARRLIALSDIEVLIASARERPEALHASGATPSSGRGGSAATPSTAAPLNTNAIPVGMASDSPSSLSQSAPASTGLGGPHARRVYSRD